jgi:hypothetical protein
VLHQSKEKHMTRKALAVVFQFGIIAIGGLTSARPGLAETLVQQNVDTRVVLAFRVGQEALQRFLPAPWRVDPVATGPSKDANLTITFLDQLLNQDGEGKPIAGGTTRIVALGIPAKNGQTGEAAPFLLRAFDANPQGVPGPYKGAVGATIRRQASLQSADLERTTASELWEMREPGGGVIEIRLEYQRGLPTRAKPEAKPHSLVEPSFFRIYRIEQGTDVVKSVPAAIDRVRSYHFRVTVQELRTLFDGTEQLVSIAVLPWYLRQVFLP